MLSLSSSVTPCTVRRGVWSPASGVARRPCQSLLFSLDSVALSPLLSGISGSTGRIRLSLSSSLIPVFLFPSNHHAPSQYVRSFVPSSQPYQRPRVCVSTSTFTGACFRSNIRFLRLREHLPLPTRLTLLDSTPLHSTRSLARSQSLPPCRALSLRPSTLRLRPRLLARCSIL